MIKNQWGMRSLVFLCCVLVIFQLLGCEQKTGVNGVSEIDVRPAGMQREKAVAYLKSPNLNKINHDELLLSSGKVIALGSNVIVPDAVFLVSMFDEKRKAELVAGGGEFDVMIDEKVGVVCLQSQCAKVFYICTKIDGGECKYFQ